MRTQKRGFFNFIFAFLPGAAEMYMGFMKMGISLMGGFFGMIGLIGFLGLSDAFMMIPIVLWFYSFFHARNIATCRPDIFMMIHDDYFWNELLDGKEINIRADKTKKISAWILIIVGVSMLWNLVMRPISNGLDYLADLTGGFIFDALNTVLNSLPRLLFAFVIIFIGIKLILGKKKDLYITDSYSSGSSFYKDEPMTVNTDSFEVSVTDTEKPDEKENKAETTITSFCNNETPKEKEG